MGWKVSITKNLVKQGTWIENQINRELEISPTYEKNKDDNITFRLMFVTILSTLLAVFFIYSSLKIDNDLRKITNIKESIKKIEEEATDDMEYSNQLKYAIHYMMSRQYQKAIDALIVLRAEPFTLKDNRKLNSCYYFLAVCYYEQGILDKNVELLAKAVEFINEAIEDNRHPLKIEMIKRFEEENKMWKKKILKKK